MKLKLAIMAAALAAATSASAQAIPDAVGPSNGELKWNGSIEESCNLSGFIDGTVVANINQTILSSTLSGGAAAIVDSRTNAAGYTLVFGAPQLFNGAGDDVSWMAASINVDPVGSGTLLNGTVVGDFGAVNGNLTFTDAGIYKATVNAVVNAPAGQAFQAGTYQVRVPVNCVKQ